MPEQNNNSKDFHEAIGQAIVRWSAVEDALCDVFTRLTICGITGRGISFGDRPDSITSHSFFILGNIFYSSTNISSRLDLMDKIVNRLILHDQLIAEWNAIKNKTKMLYKKRNILAHGAVYSNDPSNPSFIGYAFHSLRFDKLEYDQILQAEASFKNLSERIRRFAIDANRYLAS